MNLRTLKKKCKRAVAVLIEKHGYCAEDFTPSDGEEAIYAPTTMERRYCFHHFLKRGPLAGTPILWRKVSYEYDEWDAFLPTEVLEEIEFYENYDHEKDPMWSAPIPIPSAAA